jgi:hypothetical protein
MTATPPADAGWHGSALITMAPLTRARGAADSNKLVRPSYAEQTDRLEPALRLLVDVAISF